MSFPIKVKSDTIELIVRTSCYCILDLLFVTDSTVQNTGETGDSFEATLGKEEIHRRILLYLLLCAYFYIVPVFDTGANISTLLLMPLSYWHIELSPKD